MSQPPSPFSRRNVLRVGALTGGLAVAASMGARPAAAATATTRVIPRAADDLVDSFGVVTHFNFRDTVYGEHARVIDWLGRLGVRHVRTRLSPQADVMDAFEQLAAQGIKVNATCGALGDPQTMDSLMNAVKSRFADPAAIFSAFEGINEPNNNGVPWVEETRQKSRDLYAARSKYGLTGIPIAAPSLARVTSGGVEGATTWEQAGNLGDLSDVLDLGNMHVYPRGLQPSGDLDYFSGASRRVCDTRPIMCTEGGYFTAMDYIGGANPVPEEVAAAYAPQHILEHWINRTRRFFRYELLDEPDAGSADREGTLGMINTGETWTPKADFAPTRQLLRTFADPGPTFTPKPLRMALTDKPSDLRAAVFAKRDGTHLIALWLDRPIWQPNDRTMLVDSLTAPLASVQLTLGSARTVRVERLTNLGWSATHTGVTTRRIGISAGVTLLTLT